MRELKIDISDLEMAFDGGFEDIHYYLDLETGEIITVTDEERSLLESIYESYYDQQTQSVDWGAAFQDERVPGWQHHRLQDADRVEKGFGSRFITIPPDSSHEGYRDMEDFIASVDSLHLQNRLAHAIRGRGAFRRFKDVLLETPSARERWFQFKQERLQQRILDWLESQMITLVGNPIKSKDRYDPDTHSDLPDQSYPG